MLREMAKAVSYENKGLTFALLAQAGEELELALRIQGGCRLVSDEQADPTASQTQKGTRTEVK